MVLAQPPFGNDLEGFGLPRMYRELDVRKTRRRLLVKTRSQVWRMLCHNKVFTPKSQRADHEPMENREIISRMV